MHLSELVETKAHLLCRQYHLKAIDDVFLGRLWCVSYSFQGLDVLDLVSLLDLWVNADEIDGGDVCALHQAQYYVSFDNF